MGVKKFWGVVKKMGVKKLGSTKKWAREKNGGKKTMVVKFFPTRIGQKTMEFLVLYFEKYTRSIQNFLRF